MDILIDEANGGLWVAALEKNALEGLEIDPAEEEVRWGSIYWAKVERIDSALDAAFLNLDGDNTGILFNTDVRKESRDGTVKKGGGEPIGKLLRPGQMVAVQAKSAYTPRDTDDDAPAEDKYPRMSMNITLPGRYLIYAPMMPENLISSRIRDKTARKQLLGMLKSLKDIQGCILRSAAQNTQTDVLIREARLLREMWSQMSEHLTGDGPQFIMAGPDAIQRALSDHASRRIGRIEVVTMEQYQMAEEWCELYAPDLVTKIHPVELDNALDDLALFGHRDVFKQIETLFQPYAILPHGGSVIIEETAALTVVDVNRGADKRSNLSVNQEAGAEIARALRLRNIGGIVIVDFLKCKGKAEEGQLIAAMEQEFLNDPCSVQIHGLTALGLMEITRARRTPPLRERLADFME